MRFGLLCGSGLRADGFTSALKKRGHPAPLHLTFQQFVQNKQLLQSILETVDILRIDSPGGGYNIWKCFADFTDISTLGYSEFHGLIYPQSPYVSGTFKSINTAREMADLQGVACTVDPNAVQCFMDKRATHDVCTSTIRMPAILPVVKSWPELNSAMKEQGLTNVFMKLRYGSAASGVLAIETRGSKLRVWTSVERVEKNFQTHLFNSLKIRKYLDDKAKELIDDIAAMGVHTETWIPKFRLDDMPVDIRLVIVGGKPAHCVIRRSKTPLTNLHLNNERLKAEQVKQKLSPAVWDEVLDIAVKASQTYPEHLCVGVDIAIHKLSKTPYLLEVNAFGDHLNNVYHEGLDPYEFQLRYLEKEFA